MADETRGDKLKARFAAMPLRAIGDGRLTDRDFRILAAVAAHDRMSSVTGKGQGAWASHRTMAAEVGADYARFSVSMNKLVELGYLQRDRLETDRRKHTYRIIYTDGDHLPQRKPSEPDAVCASANHPARDSLPECDDSPEIVCRGAQLNHEKETETRSQYISLSEGRGDAEASPYSAEARKRNSDESARHSPRQSSDQKLAGRLAIIDRSWREWDVREILAAQIEVMGMVKAGDVGGVQEERAMRIVGDIDAYIDQRVARGCH